MARTGYPSDKQDQFMVRLPDGMRDRLKAVAAANKRSVNAEIVSRLEASLSNSPDIAAIVKAAVKEALEEAKALPATTSDRRMMGDNYQQGLAANEPKWRNRELDFSEVYIRVCNILAPHGYRTLGQLADASDEELLAIPRFGRTSLEHVRQVIKDESSKITKKAGSNPLGA